jgi:cysteine desulfurase
MKKAIYLDYAAATPLDQAVLKIMKPYFSDKFYNPSATYLASRAVRQDLSGAREVIARWLGTRPSEIYFTAGATEANNLAIAGIMKKYASGEVLVSAIEHDSVIVPAEQFKCNKIASTPKGIVDINDLKKKITGQTVLISVMLVNNEIGTVQPLREISKIIAEVRKERLKVGIKMPLYLHSDAAQAGNFFDLHVSRLGIDMMSINGGKIYGPKQTGALYVLAGIELLPIIVGGGQERNLRSGTENVAGFVGFAKALDVAQNIREKESKRLKELRDLFINELEKSVPNAQFNGSHKHQSPHILHVTFPGIDNERMMMELDERGIQCAVGSACSASSSKSSHVLSAIGMDDKDARASLRFSLGRETTKKDVIYAMKLLSELIVVNKK